MDEYQPGGLGLKVDVLNNWNTWLTVALVLTIIVTIVLCFLVGHLRSRLASLERKISS